MTVTMTCRFCHPFRDVSDQLTKGQKCTHISTKANFTAIFVHHCEFVLGSAHFWSNPKRRSGINSLRTGLSKPLPQHLPSAGFAKS